MIKLKTYVGFVSTIYDIMDERLKSSESLNSIPM